MSQFRISHISHFLHYRTLIHYLISSFLHLLFPSLDMKKPNDLFICFISAWREWFHSHFQLALIKINDVQTLIINCVPYLLSCTTSLLSKGQILYMLFLCIMKMACWIHIKKQVPGASDFHSAQEIQGQTRLPEKFIFICMFYMYFICMFLCIIIYYNMNIEYYELKFIQILPSKLSFSQQLQWNTDYNFLKT